MDDRVAELVLAADLATKSSASGEATAHLLKALVLQSQLLLEQNAKILEQLERSHRHGRM